MNTNNNIVGKSILSIGCFIVIFWIAVAISWVGNIYKLTRCDFEAPYKGEIVHAVGIIPIVSVFTVWNDDK